MDEQPVKRWFTSVVLPLEPRLIAYFSRRWKGADEVRDLLHDVYEKALVSAQENIPEHGEAYVFAIARNLLISKIRRGKIVNFDTLCDFERIDLEPEWLTPERHASAREELQRAIDGMETLPPRCREMVRLRKVEGLTIREVAARLGVTPSAVERQMTIAMKVLTDVMLGGHARTVREKRPVTLRVLKGGRTLDRN